MIPNDQLMEQCRREANEHRIEIVKQRLGRDLTEWELRYTGTAWREHCEGYAAALFHERSKPRLTVEEVITELREAWLEVRHCGEDENGDYEWVDPDELETELEDRLTEKINQTNG